MLEQVSIHTFIQTHGVKTENGEKLDFHTHRYLFDIYSDNSNYLCALKAGQIGFSTYAIIKTMWLANYQNLRIGYILPTEAMVEKFVGSKVNPIIQENPVIEKWAKDKDTVKQKQMGKGFIHYVGAQTATSAIMLTMDRIIIDEYDKAPQNILETFNSRLQHSQNVYKWVFSNPTIPDFGVDKYWQQSDKKKWHITHSCGETYVMDETCIDYEKEKYICPKCKGEITDEERRMGEWKKTAEGQWSGYWIPLWINPMISAKRIAEEKRTTTKEFFANFVAGIPYVNPTDALTERALEGCLSSEINSQEGRVIIGLDTAHNLHYTMMNDEGVFYYGYCESPEEKNDPNYDPYDEIDKRLRDFPRSILMADQGGDLIGVRKLQAKYPGRVFLVWSNRESKTKELMKWGENEESGKVLIDRNRVVQLLVDQINEGRIIFNGTKEDWREFFDHCLNIYRVKEIKGDENEPQYGWRWVWKRKGPDHYFFSWIYAMVGYDRFKTELATIVKKGARFPVGTEVGGDVHGNRFIRGEKMEW